jgi:hypothetical protein
MLAEMLVATRSTPGKGVIRYRLPSGHPVHVSHKCSEWILLLLALSAQADPHACAA